MKNRRFVFALPLLAATALSAEPMSSPNFAIAWDVADSGGGTMLSTNYTMTDSVGQPSPIGTATSINYVLEGGFATPPDSDADQVRNFMDNCTLDPNPDQLDTNGDGYGNRCDADISNDGVINFIDLGLLKAAFFSNPASGNWNPDADFTGDNQVNFVDLGQMKFFFFSSPGPSGIAP